jgi:hypothetical protein
MIIEVEPEPYVCYFPAGYIHCKYIPVLMEAAPCE